MGHLLMSWVSHASELRSPDLHNLLGLIRFGTLSSSNVNHVMGHPNVANNKKCRRMVRKFVQKEEQACMEYEIPRSPISFICLTEKSEIALGYREKVNGWSYCNFTMTDINAFVTEGDTNIKITDGKHLYSIVSAKDHTANVSPTLIQTDFSTRLSTKLCNLPFTIAKDQAVCCYKGKLYVFNGIRKGESPLADAFVYNVTTMTWREIVMPDDVVEPFYAFGHRGKIYLAQQYSQSLVIGGAKSCREVEKLDVSIDADQWEPCATLPKHVHGLSATGGPKKLILNFIGAAQTYEKKIYVFLDSREMYFDYTSAYLGEDGGLPEQGTVLVYDESKGGTRRKSPAARAVDGKWLPCRFAPVAFTKPFVFLNNLESFITGSDEYQ